MMGGSQPLPPVRQRIRVQLPCGPCSHYGVCQIQEQLEQDLTLNIEGIGTPVTVAITCSLFAKRREPRDPELVARVMTAARTGRALAAQRRRVGPPETP